MPGERSPRQDRGTVDEQQVRAALNRYVAARSARSPERPGSDAELLAARLALAALLQEAGWQPEDAVRDALEADARRLRADHRRTA